MLDLLPDLFDRYDAQLSLLAPHYRQFGQKHIFWGEVVTVKCHEDNSKVKQLLSQPGQGKVLVVDGGGSNRRALLGDMIAQSAVDNGWSGIVINGYVRDVAALKQMPIGIQALGANPIKTDKRDLGDVNITLEIDRVIIKPGMMLYADDNGIAVSSMPLDLS
ncbi:MULTISPECIES: putative 4-hydroxy-4-methyl-2-oxoglutarate aldolase [Shewanella]|uniref:4-hydroxy-4-methyl-2-oxoglutarate aldolase n=1 Tax=Shewanella marisflavi TaxID=260364 RepID=A0AAC9U0E9_9GAMM|nr:MULTISPECIES: putative 4-hydroxy-4-methyl-2-oxoglutarate aldolase [Shewanella]ASJ96657.1 ribonuclease activity regulator protein RraA [Shewanella marisflavi]MCL1041277.1 putative 4-hydroxy-4-methyl-2-oxoglutarate aldolase [Shewanella marisflavi]